jgi:hypothetical protein
MTQTKIERLKAIKEEFARTQTALTRARKLEESARPTALATLLENDLDQAELILAAQDMMHKLQNMAEDLAKMNAQDLFPLVDKMKASFGQEAAHAFEATSQEAITGAMNAVRHAKDETGNSIMRLEGKIPANDMAASATPTAPTSDLAGDASGDVAGGDVDSAMDDFGGADAAAGPDSEPLGRARKESVEGGKALNESVVLETAGRRLIETEGLDSLIGWVLNEAAAGMPEDHFRSFATSIAQKAARDPAKLAGWIGKKKHGMAAMAHLAEPTYTQNDETELEVMEGKSYKRGDDADEDEGKKSKDVERQNARKRKNGDKVDEGKTFKANDDDDDNWSKKGKDTERQSARKRKGDDKVDETALAVKAVAQLIESSIKRDGKGNAAKAVREAAAYLDGKNLVEGDTDTESLVVQAFTEAFGMKPAAYSVLKLREFIAPMGTKAPAAPMSPTDKKNANSALGKVAGKMGTNPTAAKQSVQSAMAGMDGMERNAATKLLNQMKKDGQAPKNAGEFAEKASTMVGDDKNGVQEAKKPGLAALNRDARDQYNADVKSGKFEGTFKDYMNEPLGKKVDENINAAHWPVDSQGQYKGEPMSTDYGKLKPLTGAPKAGKTEGGAPETKVEEPKVDGAKAPESDKPWEKKSADKKPSEPKAEEPKEESNDSDEAKK